MKAVLWIIIIAIILLIVWWVVFYFYAPTTAGPAAPAYLPETSSSMTGGASSTSQTVLATGTSTSLGTYLTALNGMTLYRYTKDTPNSGSSTCYGQCAALWPPYTVTSSAVTAGSLVNASGTTGTIGTITRTDGSVQVIYNGWPLYFYAKDKKPGDTMGQDVGNVWFVMKP